jgi:hypothetical protein
VGLPALLVHASQGTARRALANRERCEPAVSLDVWQRDAILRQLLQDLWVARPSVSPRTDSKQPMKSLTFWSKSLAPSDMCGGINRSPSVMSSIVSFWPCLS